MMHKPKIYKAVGSWFVRWGGWLPARFDTFDQAAAFAANLGRDWRWRDSA